MLAYIIAPVKKVLSERIWTASRAHGSYRWFRAKARGSLSDHATGSEAKNEKRTKPRLADKLELLGRSSHWIWVALWRVIEGFRESHWPK